jgi:hypothetical protein
MNEGAAAAPVQTLADYDTDPVVLRRMHEYCGATSVGQASCVSVAAVPWGDGAQATWDNAPRFPIDADAMLLRGGADVARSMSDRLLVDRMSA